MHIIYTTHEYPRPGRAHGGIGRKLQILARHLVQAGHRVTVLGLGAADAEDSDQGVRIREVQAARGLPGVRIFLNRRIVRRAIMQLIKETQVDLVEFQDSYVGLMPLGLPVPVVVRFSNTHTLYAAKLGRKPRFFRSWLEKRYLPKAFAYASCSAHVADTTARLFGLDHRIIRVLYNPIDLAEYPPPDVRKICKGMVVFVGTVYWVKGVFELMEAFRLVKQTHPGCSLYLLGRDQQLPDRPGTSTMEELKRRLPASLADSVHFMGHQPRATVLDYLAKAEVFVLPSYSEGHSNAVTEAQAMGKAIVFGANDAAAEVIEHGVSGLLANPRDPADIARQVCRVLDDTPLRDAMGLAARRLAETKFSIDVLLSANLDFYETTLAKWRDGHRVQGASRNPAKKA